MFTKNNKKTPNEFQVVSMDLLVPQDHLVRKINEVIDFSFIYPLVEDKYCLDNGRPSIDPVVLIKIMFIQYMFGIKSMRQTIKEIQVNNAYQWFLGLNFLEPVPHYSTFTKVYTQKFKDTDIFKQIFSKIINMANEKNLIDYESVFIDSTHTKAYANKRKIRNEMIEESKSLYVQKFNKEVDEYRISEGNEPIQSAPKKAVISVTDPECGMFHKGEKERQLAYSTQVCCEKNGWVTNVQVFPGSANDNKSGSIFLEEVLTNHDINYVVMDAGYTGKILLNQVIENGFVPVVPYCSPKGKKRKDENGKSLPSSEKYNKFDYKYIESEDKYLCPNDKNLTYRGVSKDGYKIYASRTRDCKNCPFINKCTSQKTKTITRHLYEKASEMARTIRLSDEGKSIYPIRKESIERCFAESKFNHLLGFTFLRGLKKNQDRAEMIFSMLNLKKLIKFA